MVIVDMSLWTKGVRPNVLDDRGFKDYVPELRFWHYLHCVLRSSRNPPENELGPIQCSSVPCPARGPIAIVIRRGRLKITEPLFLLAHRLVVS